ncbi:MAG: SAM-dependent methyltransferase [Acidimicrobiales bacterium]
MSGGQTRIRLAALVALRWPEWPAEAVAAAIADGRMLVDGRTLTNPEARVERGAQVRFEPERELAGRRKLGWAITRFGVRPEGRIALDIGASTGGFTSAWLEAGAARVYAVDAGHGQLLGSLRQDPRVVNLERTNVADLDARLVTDPVSLVSVDVSYLSLTSAIAQLGRVTVDDGADLLGLIKPMFELRLATIPTDGETLERACDAATTGAAAAGWSVVGVEECPVRGGRGAVEFVLHATR